MHYQLRSRANHLLSLDNQVRLLLFHKGGEIHELSFSKKVWKEQITSGKLSFVHKPYLPAFMRSLHTPRIKSIAFPLTVHMTRSLHSCSRHYQSSHGNNPWRHSVQKNISQSQHRLGHESQLDGIDDDVGAEKDPFDAFAHAEDRFDPLKFHDEQDDFFDDENSSSVPIVKSAQMNSQNANVSITPQQNRSSIVAKDSVRYLSRHIETASYSGKVQYNASKRNLEAAVFDALCLHLLKVMARLQIETFDTQRNIVKRMNKNESRIYRGLIQQFSSLCAQHFESYQELFQRNAVHVSMRESAVYFDALEPRVTLSPAGKARYDFHNAPRKTHNKKDNTPPKTETPAELGPNALPHIATRDQLEYHCEQIHEEIEEVEHRAGSAMSDRASGSLPAFNVGMPIVTPFRTDIHAVALKKCRAASFPVFFEHVQVFQHYDEILASVEANAVTIFRAATGSGKSTGVPIILLDAIAKRAQTQNRGRILCIQPRRLAATSIASYIKAIRQEETGQGDIGSIVRFDVNVRIEQDVLIYMTTGVFLRMLMGEETFETVSHIIIDEIHERSLEIDIILLLLRELLIANQKDTPRKFPKLILMSATFDTAKFESYFRSFGISIGSLLITVAKRFSVDVLPLEEVLKRTAHIGSSFLGFHHPEFGIRKRLMQFKGSRRRTHEREIRAGQGVQPPAVNQLMHAHQLNLCVAHQLSKFHEKALSSDFDLDFALIVKTILAIHDENKSDNGTVLVFLPTMAAIKTVEQALIDLRQSSVFKIIKLHSKLERSSVEIYEPAPGNMRKVILSTNIAQTSLTIPDVVYIVDSGVQHMRIIEKGAEIPYRCDGRISKACATQRAGRAGRVANGVVYQLFSSWEKQHLMDDFLLPEIQRTLHEHICLLMVSGGWVQSPQKLLARAIDPPPAARVARALELLQELQAIETLPDGQKYRATNVGYVMSKLDLEPRTAKMVVLAKAFGILPIGLLAAPLIEVEQILSYAISSESRCEKLRYACANTKNDFLALMRLLQNSVRHKEGLSNWCNMNDLLFMEMEGAIANYGRLVSAAEHCYGDRADSAGNMQYGDASKLALRFYATLSGSLASTVMDPSILRRTSAIVTRRHGKEYDVTIASPSAVQMKEVSKAVRHSKGPIPILFNKCYQRKTLSRKIQTVCIGDLLSHLVLSPNVTVDVDAARITFNEGLLVLSCKKGIAEALHKLRKLVGRYIELSAALHSYRTEGARLAVCALLDDTKITRIEYDKERDLFGVNSGHRTFDSHRGMWRR